MNPVLESAHFQLTRRCNLRCRFCGQTRGMADGADTELPIEFWLDAADQLKECSGVQTPFVMLWGGEPLLYKDFDKLAAELKTKGIRVGIVTNGTMIDKHAETLKLIDEIHISIDGREDLNDYVRGNGTYQKVKNNIELLKGRRGTLNCLVTVSDANVAELADIPDQLSAFNPDSITLGQLMYLNGDEIADYREYSRKNFGCDYPELEVWRRDDDKSYKEQLVRSVGDLKNRTYPIKVVFTPHSADGVSCVQSSRRIHIRYDGEIGFCTDYFSFSAGNLKEKSLKEIFYGERAELFRKAVKNKELAICRHCPWRLQNQP